jgi:hypothetical protein
MDMSHEENLSKGFVKEEVKGPSIAELRERKRKQEERAAARDMRFNREKLMKNGRKTQWWQKKRRKEENFWHVENVGRAGREFEKNTAVNLVSRKTNKIQGADWKEYQHWFPADAKRGGGVMR